MTKTQQPKMTKEGLKLAVTLGSVMLCILSTISTCNSKLENKKLHSKAEQVNTKFTEYVNRQGQIIAEQDQVIAYYKDKLLKQALDKENWMKDVQSQLKYTNKVVIRQVLVPFRDTVIKIVNIDSAKKDTATFIRVPLQFAKLDKWYQISGSVTDKGVVFDSLAFINSFRVTWANKKQGFLKRSAPIVQVVAHNPYSKTISMQNINIRPKTPLVKKPLVWLGIGAITTFFITK